MIGSRKVPNIIVGTSLKKRDRLAYKNFVLEIIEDTFIYEFRPTELVKNGELFTLILGPVDGNGNGVYDTLYSASLGDGNELVGEPSDIEEREIKGYRFIVDILQVDNIKDYIDVFLFGVKQPGDRYTVTTDTDTTIFPSVNYTDYNIIKIEFLEGITRVPETVVKEDFTIKGKIAEIV